MEPKQSPVRHESSIRGLHRVGLFSPCPYFYIYWVLTIRILSTVLGSDYSWIDSNYF